MIKDPKDISEILAGNVHVYSVSEVINDINNLLLTNYADVYIKGEVNDLSTPPSGHVYFVLKDTENRQSTLQAVMFKTVYERQQRELISGRVVIVEGMLTIYPPRGLFQVVVRNFVDGGAGLIALEFEALKRKLMEEGLTDEARKRSLPRIPSKIGIVTSLEAAALKDMLRILESKVAAHVVISHASVQGEEAPLQLVSALKRLEKVDGLEVVIIGRGGGSAEDLAPFNDENLARVVAGFPVPVISAVGHEVDWTICDLVADVRAPTPTAAAHMVIASKEELLGELAKVEIRLKRSIEAGVSKLRNRLLSAGIKLSPPRKSVIFYRQRIGELYSQIAGDIHKKVSQNRLMLEKLTVSLEHLHPKSTLHQKREKLTRKISEMESVMRKLISENKSKIELNSAKLDVLSPLKVLSRGYSITTRLRDGAIVKSPMDVANGEMVEVRLKEGNLMCEAKKNPESAI